MCNCKLGIEFRPGLHDRLGEVKVLKSLWKPRLLCYHQCLDLKGRCLDSTFGGVYFRSRKSLFPLCLSLEWSSRNAVLSSGEQQCSPITTYKVTSEYGFQQLVLERIWELHLLIFFLNKKKKRQSRTNSTSEMWGQKKRVTLLRSCCDYYRDSPLD